MTRMKLYAAALAIFLAGGPLLAGPQAPQGGTIYGRVTDKAKNPLSGAAVTVYGPALMGQRSYISSPSGQFFFPLLPPGTYDVRLEMPGFKVQVEAGIRLETGRTTELTAELAETATDEEVSAPARAASLDRRSARTEMVFGRDVITRIPLARDFAGVLALIPGAVVDLAGSDRRASIAGANVAGQMVTLAGAPMNDPVTGEVLGNLNFDIYDMVEVETAGHPAAVGPTAGGFIRIVPRSGANASAGDVTYYSTGDLFAQDLASNASSSFRARPADRLNYYRDLSLNLGGSLMENRAWIHLAGRYLKSQIPNPYTPEDRMDLMGVYNNQHFELDRREWMTYAHVAVQATKEIKYSGLFHYSGLYEPFSSDAIAPDAAADRVPIRKPDYVLATTHNANILIDQNTYADVRASLVFHGFTLASRTTDLPASFDLLRQVWWGAPASSEVGKSQRLGGGGSITHFKEAFLGLDHELKLGAEFEQTESHADFYRSNPYTSYWYDYAKRNPYYEDGTSTGRLEIMPVPYTAGGWDVQEGTRRFSAFVQDTLTRKRLAVSLGLRFDFSFLYMPEQTRPTLGYNMGPELLNPDLAANDLLDALDLAIQNTGVLSPLQGITTGYRKPVSFLTLSPRLGLVYGLTADGRATLRLSYARSSEPVWIGTYNKGQFYGPFPVSFQWRDLDANGLMDLPNVDGYTFISSAAQNPAVGFYEGIKPPVTDEFTAGLEFQASKDLRLSLSLIRRKTTSLIEVVDAVNGYDPNLTDEVGPVWLPLTVTDPGRDGRFGTGDDQPLTVYGLRADRPAPSWKAVNPPEAYRKYWALNFGFDKRMSNNWQLNGSVVYSSFRGTEEAGVLSVTGRTGAFNDPNAVLNNDGPLAFDRPFQVKVLGTYVLPLDISVSAFFQLYSGAPWARTLSRVYFPENYLGYGTREPYVTVLADQRGAERSAAYANLDLRLEKTFGLTGGGKLSLILDVLNAGGRYGTVWNEDPAGVLDYRVTPASYATLSTYGQVLNLYGVRQFRIGARLEF